MTFDDGTKYSIAIEDVKARLRAGMKTENIGWKPLCHKASLDPARALRAIDHGEDLPALAQLASALGRDAEWLLTGSDAALQRFRVSLQERLYALVWRYVYRAEISHDEGKRLWARVERMISGVRCSTTAGAHRAGIPMSLKDVAAIHREMQHGGK